MLTPEERTQRARVAAYARHQHQDPVEATAAARRALWAKYTRQVDPDAALAPDERERRARCAMRADLARNALLVSKRKREQADEALADELLAVTA